jgi:hypothetical protein
MTRGYNQTMPAAVPPLPEVPAPAPPFGLDKRQLIGLGLGLVCVGVLIGFKLGAGAEPLIIDRPVERTVFRDRPCADCAEKKAQAVEPQQSVPGDSSVPED